MKKCKRCKGDGEIYCEGECSDCGKACEDTDECPVCKGTGDDTL